jgi:hypothetical protein
MNWYPSEAGNQKNSFFIRYIQEISVYPDLFVWER